MISTFFVLSRIRTFPKKIYRIIKIKNEKMGEEFSLCCFRIFQIAFVSFFCVKEFLEMSMRKGREEINRKKNYREAEKTIMESKVKWSVSTNANGWGMEMQRCIPRNILQNKWQYSSTKQNYPLSIRSFYRWTTSFRCLLRHGAQTGWETTSG